MKTTRTRQQHATSQSLVASWPCDSGLGVALHARLWSLPVISHTSPVSHFSHKRLRLLRDTLCASHTLQRHARIISRMTCTRSFLCQPRIVVAIARLSGVCADLLGIRTLWCPTIVHLLVAEGFLARNLVGNIGDVVLVLLALHAAPVAVVRVGEEEEDDDPDDDDDGYDTEADDEANGGG